MTKTRDRLEAAERKHQGKHGRPRCNDPRHDRRIDNAVLMNGTLLASVGGGGGTGRRVVELPATEPHDCIEAVADVLVNGWSWPASMVHDEQCSTTQWGKGRKAERCPGGGSCFGLEQGQR